MYVSRCHRRPHPALAELIIAEQQCCPFLHFQLGFDGPELHLTLTADELARPFIDDLLPVNQAGHA